MLAVKLNPTTHDRIPKLALFNVQGTIGNLTSVQIGRLPGGSTDLTKGTWMDEDARIEWPGGRQTQPVDGHSIKEIKVAVLHPFTMSGVPNYAYAETAYCAARLAERHLLSGDASVVPEVAVVTSTRRVLLLPFNTNGTAHDGMVAFSQAMDAGAEAIIGPLFSSVTVPVAMRAAGMPQISPTATSDELSNSGLFPGFARTVPSISDFSAALIGMIRLNFWTWRALGVLYVHDSYGNSFADGLEQACDASGDLLVVSRVAYEPTEQSMAAAMSRLKANEVFVVVVAAFDIHLPALFAAAEVAGLLTEDRAWLLFDAMSAATIAASDAEFAHRLHGSLQFVYAPSVEPGYERLATAWSQMTPDQCANQYFTPTQSMFGAPPPEHAAMTYDVRIRLLCYRTSCVARDDVFRPQHAYVACLYMHPIFLASP